MTTSEKNLKYYSDTIGLYEVEYDKVPHVRDGIVEKNRIVVFDGQTSTDPYIRRITAEQVMSIAASRELMNAERIRRSLIKVQALYTEYEQNSFYELTGNAFSRALIKLINHLNCPYTDDEFTREAMRHQDLAHEVGIDMLKKIPFQSVVIAGSLSNIKSSLWHPFLSDIDLVLLRRGEDLPISLSDIHAEYAKYTNPPRTPWIYINYGGQIGIDGLHRDPYEAMFALEALPQLTEQEASYRARLFASGAELITGDINTTMQYFKDLDVQIR